jgi:hypothetical protein
MDRGSMSLALHEELDYRSLSFLFDKIFFELVVLTLLEFPNNTPYG